VGTGEPWRLELPGPHDATSEAEHAGAASRGGHASAMVRVFDVRLHGESPQTCDVVETDTSLPYFGHELPSRQIFFSIHAGEEERGARGKRAEGACWGIGKEAKNIQEERRRSAGDWRGRATLHLNSGRFSDCAEGEWREEEVVLWSSLARDLSSNLAGVFKVDGVEEATRKAAAAMIWRTKVMARCYSILRVALQDIIEGKVSRRYHLEAFFGGSVAASEC